MDKLTLYHASPSRSSIVLWMLEELGQPYDVQLVSLSKGENREPGYLTVNPMGKVPAIRHGDTVITEVAAICTYLADEFPAAKLNVPIGSPKRGVYLKWLFFAPSCFEPAVMDRVAPRKEEPRRAMLGYGDFDTTMNVAAAAIEKAVADGRAVHRRRRRTRRAYPLGHDVQDGARAARVLGLRGADCRASRRAACRGEGQGVRREAMTIALIAAMAVLAALAVWRVARRAWDYLAIALLAVAAMPLVAAGPTGDMSRYLPSAFSGGPDGVGEIALVSALSTFCVAVILAAAVWWIARMCWRRFA